MAVRTCSMSAGLLTSTWTPGRTAPDVSLTTPAMLLCADAATGSRRTPSDDAITTWTIRSRIIETLLAFGRRGPPAWRATGGYGLGIATGTGLANFVASIGTFGCTSV